ncbi:putative 26S proteasome regulatory subunit rpn7 [Dictyocoela muelleri]|nr:putative 26S proteasome regulatory subunit rpn7 [Dictyocoela muelleri]
MERTFTEPTLDLLKKIKTLKNNQQLLKKFIIDNNYSYLYKKYFTTNPDIYNQAEYDSLIHKNNLREQEIVSSFINDDQMLYIKLCEFYGQIMDIEKFINQLRKIRNFENKGKLEKGDKLDDNEKSENKTEKLKTDERNTDDHNTNHHNTNDNINEHNTNHHNTNHHNTNHHNTDDNIKEHNTDDLNFDDLKIDDSFFCLLRMAFILNDIPLLRKLFLRDLNADWDKRNKFKAYKAVYFLIDKRYKESAEMFVDILPTYDSSELASYKEAQIYTLFSSIVGFERNELVSDLQEFIEVNVNQCDSNVNVDGFINTTKNSITSQNGSLQIKTTEEIASKEDLILSEMKILLKMIINCDYSPIFRQLIKTCELLVNDVFVGNMICDFIDNVKINIINQILKSYQTIGISSMASLLSISEDYLESLIFKYVLSEKVFCVIDKVNKNIIVKKRNVDYRKEILRLGERIRTFVESDAAMK